ncbi:MAG: polysaccharide deacetylase [Firmicutes bacterium HGW-Firmicutes-21]|nr:MAG: polysaccharide deacetylase [Firmicutes bacterium HGW-Firmicutes-21]
MFIKRYICVLITALIIVAIFVYPYFESRSYLLFDEIIADEDTVYIPIIMYHHVRNNSPGKNSITPKEFESDLKYLKKNNYNTITMTQLIDYVYNDISLPENPIIISFDDGYLNTYKNAYPLLMEYDMKIVLSIIGKVTDDFTLTISNNINTSHMNWNHLNEMINSGHVEVQNHTYNLHSTRSDRYGCAQKENEAFAIYRDVLAEDINKLQNQLMANSGVTPNTFTYPYGRFNDNTVIIIKELGFKASLSVLYGLNKITKDKECLYDLKRICRSHGVPIEKLLKDVAKTVR